MSDASSFGFGKFIPGFDFLQGLAQSAGSAAKPLGGMPQWVAPTVSIEEVEKRITELKAVQFWLEQNGRALAATIQALEVQRMTLSTLKGMNVSMGELAKAFQFPGGGEAGGAKAQDFSEWPMNAAANAAAAGGQAQEAAAPAEPRKPAAGSAGTAAEATAESRAEGGEQAAEPAQAALNQAMQWWGSLTQQFQQIAAKALAEPVPPETLMAAQRATEMASGLAKATMDQVMSFGKASAEGAAQSAAASAKPAKAPSAASSRAAAAKSPAKPAAKKAPAAPAAKKAAAKTGGSRAR
ncbi:PhaM family polyhydroxyalkanoate granule multifunctional regulatory protein [Comamonas terrae]|uniref:PhaM family polyhydroxyalkanoate granule multifunctional regulatory protein n=1 Tax=Comamonas terrae TaxID=673548 RepID=A0ABW5UI02_9BURK|nr:PhaM family polyhydroxyalkanoate granule multifunctional regulatory protein [Comamonas terrae]